MISIIDEVSPCMFCQRSCYAIPLIRKLGCVNVKAEVALKTEFYIFSIEKKTQGYKENLKRYSL